MNQTQVSPDFDRLADLPDRIKLPLLFDALALVSDVERLLQEVWTAHFVPQNYDGDWSVMPLRGPAGAGHPILQITSPPGCTDWEDTIWMPHCPAIRAAIAQIEAPLGAIRLMRLGAGSQILEHSDPDLSAAFGMARLHIPMITNPHVDFRVNRSPVTMAPGECWYLRLSDPHSVHNRGPTARIHLVIDAQVNDWLANQLSTAAQMPMAR